MISGRMNSSRKKYSNIKRFRAEKTIAGMVFSRSIRYHENNKKKSTIKKCEHQRRLEEARKKPKDPRDDLVKYLSEGDHPVEAGLRPEKTVKLFKEAIDHGYVHVK